MTAFRARAITDTVYWVGAIDWELPEFHGYATPRGTTYNAFLILDDRVTLIDTVKEKFTDELLARISSVIHPSRIDVIVSNHAEMDHSGGLLKVIEAVQPSTVVASPKGAKALEQHFHTNLDIQTVKDNSTLSIGTHTLSFTLSTLVHWPDSMFTHMDGDNILFSNDAFGMHLASSRLWADEVPADIVHEETKTYYANILWPTSKNVRNALAKLDPIRPNLAMILPDHGPMWRRDLDRPIGWYDDWSNGSRDATKAVVLFDTMWGSTAKMARSIADGLIEGGMQVSVLPLAKTSRATVALECLDASLIAVGSPVLNGGLFPTVADALTYLGGLMPGKEAVKGAVFGSYGWAPGLFKKDLPKTLEDMGLELIGTAETVNYVPSADDLASCHAYGIELAKQMRTGGNN